MRPLMAVMLLALWAATLSAQTVKDEDLSLVRAIVFKDGFVYTFREGSATPQNGEVLLRTIPQAREGTLYAYIVDGKATIARLELRQVPIGERKEKSERIFSDLYELLRQNEGKKVRLTTTKGETLEGVLRVVTPIHEDPSLPRDPQKPVRVAYIALEGETTALVRTDQIERLIFLEPATLKEVREFVIPVTERRLAIIFNDAEDGKPMKLGIAALEQGLRWDATYRIMVSDERPIRNARVELVATIDNRLLDLKDTVLMLAVGMPNFPYRTQLASLIAPPGYQVRAGLEREKGFPGAAGPTVTQTLAIQPAPEITPTLPAEVELPSLEAAWKRLNWSFTKRLLCPSSRANEPVWCFSRRICRAAKSLSGQSLEQTCQEQPFPTSSLLKALVP